MGGETRLIYLGKRNPNDPESTFDEILLRMTPQEQYGYDDFFLRTAPRPRTQTTRAPTPSPKKRAGQPGAASPPDKIFKSKAKGAGRGGKPPGAPPVVPKVKAKAKAKAKPFSLWKGAKKSALQGDKDKAEGKGKGAESTDDWKSKKICHFYKRGKCERDPCPFLHQN